MPISLDTCSVQTIAAEKYVLCVSRSFELFVKTGKSPENVASLSRQTTRTLKSSSFCTEDESHDGDGRSSPGGKEDPLVSNDDLMRAIVRVPRRRLAFMDEGFECLGSGIGALFNEPRAPAVRVARRQAVFDEGASPTNSARSASFDLRKRFQKSVDRIAAPMKQQAAEKATMNLISDLYVRGPTPPDVCAEHVQPAQEIDPEHQLLEDAEVREWAEDELHLPSCRLGGLENSAEFRGKLGHQMLCWQALHMTKIDVPHLDASPGFLSDGSGDDLGDFDLQSAVPNPGCRESRSTSASPPSTSAPSRTLRQKLDSRASATPSPALVEATKSLFGLAHHLDAQNNRRSMTPQMRAYSNAQNGRSPTPPVDFQRSATHSSGDAQTGIPARRRSATAPAGAAKLARVNRPSKNNRFDSLQITPTTVAMISGTGSDEDDGMKAKIMLASKWAAKLPSFGQARDGALGISLRNPRAFIEPHTKIMSSDVGNTPEFAYLRRCEHAGLVPCTAVWRQFGGGKGMIDARKRSLRDADISAIVDTAVQCAVQGYVFQRLDLDDNVLTDDGLSRVAKSLAGPPMVCTRLTSLSLAGNTSLKLKSEQAALGLASALESLPLLSSFDMSRVQLHGDFAIGLVSALRKCSSLRRLNLADCGLGRTDQRECVAVAELLGCGKGSRLERVDLSANFFGRVGFAAAANALRSSQLTFLAFSGNGGSNMGSATDQEVRFHPMQLLFESLLLNSSVEELDVSNCGIGPDTVFVLEDALSQHPRIKSIALAENPLGDAGLRALIRLLICMGSDLRSCDVAGHRDAEPSAHPVRFSFCQPGGEYTLDLRLPHERAIFRTLLRKSEQITNGSSAQCLRWFKFDAKGQKPTATKDAERDRWAVPQAGISSFVFQPPLSKTVQQYRAQQAQKTDGSSTSADNVGTDAGATRKTLLTVSGGKRQRIPEFEEESASDRRLAVTARERWGQLPTTRYGRGTYGKPWEPPKDSYVVPLSEASSIMLGSRVQLSMLRYPAVRKMFLSCATRDEQLRFVHACSQDIGFKVPQISQLCTDLPELAFVIMTSLLPGVRSRSAQLRFLNALDPANVLMIMKEMRQCLWLPEGSITGRYHLELSKPADYLTAERCLLVNAWESEIVRAQRRPDLSQQGNYEMLRNEAHRETPFEYSRRWILPGTGSFRFDYSSMLRPPSDAVPMSQFGDMLKQLKASSADSIAKLRVIRAVSVHFFVSTDQFGGLCKLFKVGSERQELFCILHTRVIDAWQLLGPELLYAADGFFQPADLVALRERVGHLQVLNPLRSDLIEFTLNLMVYEERTVLDFLVQLTLKEAGGKVTGTSNHDKFERVSASWVSHGVPTIDAVFLASYKTPCRNLDWRRTLAEQYCGEQFRLAPNWTIGGPRPPASPPSRPLGPLWRYSKMYKPNGGHKDRPAYSALEPLPVPGEESGQPEG